MSLAYHAFCVLYGKELCPIPGEITALHDVYWSNNQHRQAARFEDTRGDAAHDPASSPTQPMGGQGDDGAAFCPSIVLRRAYNGGGHIGIERNRAAQRK